MSRLSGARVPETVKEDAYDDYCAGMPRKRVCEKHNVSPGTLRTLVKNKELRGVFDNEATGAKIGRIPTFHDGVRDVRGGYEKSGIARELMVLASSKTTSTTTDDVPSGGKERHPITVHSVSESWNNQQGT